jgi:hypothetical protein
VRRYEQAKSQGEPLMGRPPAASPRKPAVGRSDRINVTDPDSRILKVRQGFLQGYNAQAVAGGGQVIIGAALAESSDDSHALHPMLRHAREELDKIGITDRMRVCVADSGYGGKTNLSQPAEPILLVATRSGRNRRAVNDPKSPAIKAMSRRLDSPPGKALYRRRSFMIEPVFGQIKNRLGADLKHRGTEMVTTEWRLIAASHNLLKYWRHQQRQAND